MMSFAEFAAQSKAAIENAQYEDDVRVCLESVESSMYLGDSLDAISS